MSPLTSPRLVSGFFRANRLLLQVFAVIRVLDVGADVADALTPDPAVGVVVTLAAVQLVVAGQTPEVVVSVTTP